MTEKQDLEYDKDAYVQEKAYAGDTLELNEEDEVENSKIEAVRLGKNFVRRIGLLVPLYNFK